jgi:hypothetical protein
LGAVFVVGLFLTLYTTLHFASDAGTALATDVGARQERAKVLWASAALGLSMALLWCVVAAIEIIVRMSSGFENKIVRCIWGSVLIANVIGWAWLARFDAGGIISKHLIELIRDRAKLPIDKLILAGNGLAFLAISLVVTSVCLLAARPSQLEVDVVVERIKLFSVSLYGSATLLASGLIEIVALFKWGVAVAPDEMIRLDTAADARAIFLGVAYSVLLIGIYAPVALLHQRWLESIVKDESARQAGWSIAEWLSVNGLKSSPWNVIGKGIAMLFPLATGLIVKLLA